MPTLLPSAIVSQSGLYGSIAALADDPASPDDTWLTSTEALSSGVYRLYPSGPAYATEAETIAAINAEVVKAIDDAGGRPLPLVGHWHRPSLPISWQREKIGQGYPLLPWTLQRAAGDGVGETVGSLTGDDLAWVAEKKLPVCFLFGQEWQDYLRNDALSYYKVPWQETCRGIFGQATITGATINDTTSVTFTTAATWNQKPHGWLRNLTGDWAALNDAYRVVTNIDATSFSIQYNASEFAPYDNNGGEILTSGEVASPFGDPATGFYNLGLDWSGGSELAAVQSAYPDPPAIFFCHNNESSDIEENGSIGVEAEVRYRDDFGTGTNQITKRRALFDNYVRSWGAFRQGIVDSLSEAWGGVMRTFGYNVIWQRRARWGFFSSGSVWTLNMGTVDDAENTLSWAWHAYDGSSTELYDNWWEFRAGWPAQSKATWLVYSPQNEAMITKFQFDLASEFGLAE
jgi:hypothetical protein